MTYLYNLAIACLLLISFNEIGRVANNKLFSKKINFHIPMGFIITLVAFNFFVLFFVLLNFNFSIVKYITIICFIIIFVRSLYKIKNLGIKKIFSRYNQKYYIIVDVLSILLGIYLLVYSRSLVDSHLYMRMSTIQNYSNYIYSYDGTSLMSGLYWHHFTEPYYLFQSIFADISFMTPYMYCITIFKFIEGFIVIQIIGYLFEEIMGDNRLESFLLLLIGIIFSIVAFVPYELDLVRIFLMNMSANGTLLLYMFFIPYTFIIVSQRNKIIKYRYMLLILMSFGFLISSSMLFVGVFLILILVIYDAFYLKDYSEMKSYYLCLIFPVVYAFTYFIFPSIGFIFYLVSITIIIAFFIGTSTLFKYSSVRFGSVILIMVSYFALIIYNIYSKDINLFAIFDFFLVKDFTIFYALGIYYLYKKNKKLCIYLLIASLIIRNPFVQPLFEISTYHRVAMLFGTYLFNISGAIFIIEFLFKNKYIKYSIYVMILLYGISINGNMYLNKLTEPFNYNSFEEYKIDNADVFKMKDYKFEVGDSVYVESYKSGENNMGQIYMVVPYLDRLLEKEPDFKYKILSKTSEEDTVGYEIVYQTEGYYLYKKIGR